MTEQQLPLQLCLLLITYLCNISFLKKDCYEYFPDYSDYNLGFPTDYMANYIWGYACSSCVCNAFLWVLWVLTIVHKHACINCLETLNCPLGWVRELVVCEPCNTLGDWSECIPCLHPACVGKCIQLQHWLQHKIINRCYNIVLRCWLLALQFMWRHRVKATSSKMVI